MVLIDRAGVQDRVCRALARGPGRERCPALVRGDLIEDGLNRLLGSVSARDQSLPTLVIAEGLLMYMPEPHVRALLAGIAALPCARVRLIATYMDTPPGEPIGFRGQSGLVRTWLRQRGEVMRWSFTNAALPALLGDSGLRHAATITAADLAREWNAAHHPLEGENIVVADRD